MGDQHDFDVLDKWALMSDAEVEALISADSIAALQRMEKLLVNDSPGPITSNNFTSRMRHLRDLKHRGSRALGDAILEASELAEQRQSAKAREVYERFLAVCESPFYQKIAESQLSKLR